jgi:hypothetical protein
MCRENGLKPFFFQPHQRLAQAIGRGRLHDILTKDAAVKLNTIAPARKPQLPLLADYLVVHVLDIHEIVADFAIGDATTRRQPAQQRAVE